MSMCPKCEGEGSIEYEAGLIQAQCQECKGTGEISDDNPSNSGIRQSDSNLGSDNPSQSQQLSKSKAKKKASKGAK